MENLEQNTADTTSLPETPAPKRRKSGWTSERRLKQSQAIRRWAPWTRSTGPRSAEGKLICSKNAYKHGYRSAAMARLHRVLAVQGAFVRYCNTVASLMKKNYDERTIGAVLPPFREYTSKIATFWAESRCREGTGPDPAS